MNMSTHKYLIGALWLLVALGAPLAGHRVRQLRADRCRWDGLPIIPIYGVRAINTSGESVQFCCLDCAQKWLARGVEARRVFVKDETTGQEILAADAFYVRSKIITSPATGNCVHVFAHPAAALAHARSADGVLLAGDDSPFSQRALGRVRSRNRLP